LDFTGNPPADSTPGAVNRNTTAAFCDMASKAVMAQGFVRFRDSRLPMNSTAGRGAETRVARSA
jgi:hypothetical protein